MEKARNSISKLRYPFQILFIIGLIQSACQATPPPQQIYSNPAATKELVVVKIPLAGPVSETRAEISGLAWFGETLVMLPQYPERFSGEKDGALFAITKTELLARLEGDPTPITPRPIPITFSALKQKISGYEGFEAIAIRGNKIYLTIETHQTTGMASVLVTGMILPGLEEIILDAGKLEMINAQARIANFSDESICLAGESLFTFYEANGAQFNPTPVAHRFNLDLTAQGVILAPNLEYRITDATPADDEGRFWVINYFFPGDTKIQPLTDPLAERYGIGRTHLQSKSVERLVELQWSGTKITLADHPPILLELLPGDSARNWEGIARLDGRGFLIATDQYPETILGFIAYP